jgi:hypothetical protein
LKSLFGILLIITLSAPLIGGYICIENSRIRIKKEVKKKILAGIDRKELILLKFSKKEVADNLKWENSTEFEFENKMYDIVEQHVIGDSVFYYCWDDNEETSLNKKLDEILKLVLGNDYQTKNKQKNLISYLKLVYNYNGDLYLHLILYPIKRTIYSFYFKNFSNLSISPLVPPPENT